MEEIIHELRRHLKEPTEGDKASFPEPGYNTIEVRKQHFREIQPTPGKLCFVDGGSQEILKAANFSLQLIRVYYNVFENNKKVTTRRTQFFILITTDSRLNFVVKCFGGFELNVSFDSLNSRLRTGNHRVLISKIGDVIRRYAEIIMATNAGAKKVGSIVLDGTLRADTEEEQGLLDKLYVSANAPIIGLSKSTSLLTESGNSLGSVLQQMRQPGMWYHPVANTTSPRHRADIYFAKLHARATRIFRIEIHNKDPAPLFATLADNARDPVFPGYPYGLVDADKHARISNREQEFYRATLMAKLGKEWRDVESFTSLLDSHAVLDSI